MKGHHMTLQQTDPIIFNLINQERERQQNVLEMIPSENYASKAVMEALGTELTNKYSEGYQYKRYYQGNEFVDQIEALAVERIKKLFNVPHANVQPYSGSPANMAVYLACMEPGDTLMGLKLAFGGHLTHGDPVSATGVVFKSIQFELNKDGYIDIEQARKLAHEHKPKVITLGTTAYPRNLPYKEFSEIADEIGAYFHADVSHIAGMICAGVLESPVPYVHSIMFTTHKTFRGPRGAVILTTEKGLQKDPELSKKIDKWVFPGLQGGPHNNVTASIAVAAQEATTSQFISDQKQTLLNAKALAKELVSMGYNLISGGTDNHLILLDLINKNINGRLAAVALEEGNIVCNRNSIPYDPMPPFYPSGLRFGTPFITTRGMKELEMKKIAKWIDLILQESISLAKGKDVINKVDRDLFEKQVKESKTIQIVKKEVIALCKEFPLP